MTDPLFAEIDKFDHWAQSQFSIPQDEIGGEWECGYRNWENIYTAFEAFMNRRDLTEWSDKEKERLLYIIARDNEMGQLADVLPEQALIILTQYSIKYGHRDDRWQLAVQLHKLSNKLLASELLEALVNDGDEYVSRRALMELAKVGSDKVEFYADLFWNRNKYGNMDEYQKIAVLHALKTANSKQLRKYIELAKQDGRNILIEHAINLEGK